MSKQNLIGVSIFLGFMMIVFDSGAAKAEIITKEEIIHRLQEKPVFTGELRVMNEQEKAAFMNQLKVRSIAKQYLPDTLEVRSKSDKSFILENLDLSINKKNIEYNRLYLKKRLMDIVVNCKASLLLPQLSKSDKENIKNGVITLTDRARTSILKHLNGIIGQEDINKFVDNMRHRLIRDIDSPLTTAMKQEIAPSAIDRLSRVLDKRLELTKGRALSRIEQAGETEDKILRAKKIKSETEEILYEILSPLHMQILKRTSLSLFANLKSDDFVPGYAEAIQELEITGRKLREEEMRLKEKERDATRIRNELNIDTFIEDVEDDISESPKHLFEQTFIPMLEKSSEMQNTTPKVTKNAKKHEIRKDANTDEPNGSTISHRNLFRVLGLVAILTVVFLMALLGVRWLKQCAQQENVPDKNR